MTELEQELLGALRAVLPLAEKWSNHVYTHDAKGSLVAVVNLVAAVKTAQEAVAKAEAQ